MGPALPLPLAHPVPVPPNQGTERVLAPQPYLCSQLKQVPRRGKATLWDLRYRLHSVDAPGLLLNALADHAKGASANDSPDQVLLRKVAWEAEDTGALQGKEESFVNRQLELEGCWTQKGAHALQ